VTSGQALGGFVREGGKQDRARETIAAVLEVTMEVLDAHGEQGVRMEEIQRRSGVSSGSIYHHFGDRDGLIAAAQVERFDRVVRDDAVGVVTTLSEAANRGDAAVYLEAMRSQTAMVVLPERARIRWARVTALASGWRRSDLLVALGESFSRLIDALTDGVVQLQPLGAIDADLDARAVAIYSQIHSLGLLLNELDPRAITDEEWLVIMQRISVTLSPTLAHLGDHGIEWPEAAWQDRTGRTSPPGRERSEQRSGNDELFERIIALTASALQQGGPAQVRLEEIRQAVGVSQGWLRRRFGDREGLLDVTRLVLFTRSAEAELDILEGLVARATTPRGFAEGWRRALEHAGSDGDLTIDRWQRLEVLAASVGSPALRYELGLAVGELSDRAERIVRSAQEKGLLLPGLPPRAVAHYLCSQAFGLLFVELDGGRLPVARWVELLTRVIAALQPHEDESGEVF
jgi:AcrR family transcriptional regulator